jgi:hypothetical protein
MVPVKPNRAANGGVFQPECGGWEPPKHLIARAPIRRSAELRFASALMVPSEQSRERPGAAIGFFERHNRAGD